MKTIASSARDNRLWAADAGNRRYRISQWSVDGSAVPAGARVIAHLEHNEWVFAALPGNRAAIYTVDDDGTARVKIVEVVIQGR